MNWSYSETSSPLNELAYPKTNTPATNWSYSETNSTQNWSYPETNTSDTSRQLWFVHHSRIALIKDQYATKTQRDVSISCRKYSTENNRTMFAVDNGVPRRLVLAFYPMSQSSFSSSIFPDSDPRRLVFVFYPMFQSPWSSIFFFHFFVILETLLFLFLSDILFLLVTARWSQEQSGLHGESSCPLSRSCRAP